MRTLMIGILSASVCLHVPPDGARAQTIDSEEGLIVYRVDIPGITPDAEDWVTLFDVDGGATSMGTIGAEGFSFVGPDSNVSECPERDAGCMRFGDALILNDRYQPEMRSGVKVYRYPHLGCTITTLDFGDGGATKSVYCPDRGVVEWSVFQRGSMIARYSLLSSYGLLGAPR
jgi:hypothetical protein